MPLVLGVVVVQPTDLVFGVAPALEPLEDGVFVRHEQRGLVLGRWAIIETRQQTAGREERWMHHAKIGERLRDVMRERSETQGHAPQLLVGRRDGTCAIALEAGELAKMDGVPADLHGVEKKTPGFAVMVGHRRRAELVGSGTELEDRIEALAELLASHADRLVDLFNQDAMDVQQLSRMHRPE